MRTATTIITLTSLFSATCVVADTAAENCADLAGNLRSCTTYSCEFERQLINDSPETALARYSITAQDGNESCGYTVHIGGNQIIQCSLTPASRGTVTRIAEMQLDGTFEKNRALLIEAVKTIDPATGEMDSDAESSLDPEFMQLNQEFMSILESECR